MKTEFEFIHFSQSSHTEKTSTWQCLNTRRTQILGQVKWHGAWRQYCFFPETPTVFSAGCLKDIQDFIGQLMHARKNLDQDAADIAEVIGGGRRA